MGAVLSSDDPYEYFEDVVAIFTGLGYRLGQRKRGDVLVQCPGHADRGPSLHLTLKLADASHADDRIVAMCFGACAGEIERDRAGWLERMLKAVGLTPAELFVGTAGWSRAEKQRPASRTEKASAPGQPSGNVAGVAGVGLGTTASHKKQLGQAGNWLVDRMLAVGDMSVLVAKAGIGKSTFAAQLAVSVAYGRPFLGRECKQGTVVYLAFEGARSTIAQMERLGHDGHNTAILMYRGDADARNPADWLSYSVGFVSPKLIIIDTLADFARSAPGAANAGYEDMVAKLGAVYLWAQAEGCHVHLLHHGAKGDREGIDTALGTVGIVSKPGTVLDYRPLSKEDGAPRVLKGVKHREGDMETDLPGLVLDFSRERGLSVAGFKSDVQARELGVAIIKAVWDQPGGKQAEILASVDGRKQSKLEALRRLLAEDGGVLAREGKGDGSRTFPFRLSVRPGLPGDPVTIWRERFARVGSQEAEWVPTSREPTQAQSGSAESPVGSRYIVKAGNLLNPSDHHESVGSRDYVGPIAEPLIVASAQPVAAPGWCPTCSRFRCVCPAVAVAKLPTLTCSP